VDLAGSSPPCAEVALQRGKEPPAISNRMRLPAVNRCVTASSSSRTTSSLTNQIPLPAQPAGRRVRFNELGSACAVAYGQASAFGSGSSNSYSSRPIRALLPATAVLTANDGQHLKKPPSHSLRVFLFQAGHVEFDLFVALRPPAVLSQLRSLTVLCPRPVERSGQAACPNGPAIVPMCAIHQKEDDHDAPAW
jgi:hypothetical protein